MSYGFSRNPDGLQCGTMTATTSGLVVTLIPAACKELFIQADPDNTADIFIGNASVQPIQLNPGQSISFEMNNPPIIYAKSASGAQLINYLAVT